MCTGVCLRGKPEGGVGQTSLGEIASPAPSKVCGRLTDGLALVVELGQEDTVHLDWNLR